MSKALSAAQKTLLEDIVGGQEIADHLGVDRRVVYNWSTREWTGFPAPVITLQAGKFWRLSEVLEWHQKRTEKGEKA